jgi:carbon-monoxide dehydrogenase medium subunit
VKPAAFDYYAPSSVSDAIGLLTESDDPKILAGGQSLMPLLNMRLAQPTALVDLNQIAELAYVRVEGTELAVGAMTRQRTLESDSAALGAVPVLAEILEHVGHMSTRNRGTVGGSLAHADPAAELPTAAVGLDATLIVAGRDGTRVVAACDFFVTYLTTAIGADEILVEVRFPAVPDGTGYAFEELSRRHGDFALAAVLALVRLDATGHIEAASISIGGANPVPVRAHESEALLLGELASASVLAAAAEQTRRAIAPMSDVHASADYRREVTGPIARRALERAVSRAKGGAS